MALVKVSQEFILQGYTQLKEKDSIFSQSKYVRKLIHLLTYVESICDETQVETVIEQLIKKQMEELKGWGNNFEGWSSFRKYCKPAEIDKYPAGKEFELKIEYIRDWKMEKIIKELFANEFAILCKELGISAGEAINVE